jgi:hypothetical protein
VEEETVEDEDEDEWYDCVDGERNGGEEVEDEDEWYDHGDEERNGKGR